MKTKILLLFITLFNVIIAQQNFRVTTFQVYTVMKPYLDLYNNDV